MRLGQHHLPMQMLQAPPVLHEIHREPVEQFGVDRQRGAAAEVRDVRDEWLAEVARSDVVHQHAGSERVLAVGQPVGEGEPAARAGRRIRELAVRFRLVRPLEGFERGAQQLWFVSVTVSVTVSSVPGALASTLSRSQSGAKSIISSESSASPSTGEASGSKHERPSACACACVCVVCACPRSC